jgi:hypothetical protein
MLGVVRTSHPTAAGALRKWLIALSASALLTCMGFAQPGVANTVVASWEFEQVAGVIPDLQTGANNLTLSGHWSSVSGSGSHPSAIRFEAAPAVAATTAAKGQNFNPGTGSFALTVVFRATKDVTSGTPNLAQHGRFADTGQIKLQLAPGGKAGCRIKGDRSAYLFYHPAASVNDNLWHTVTCSRSGSDVFVTLDGVMFSPAGTENPGSIAVSGQTLRFAQKPATSSVADQFIGDISFASYGV